MAPDPTPVPEMIDAARRDRDALGRLLARYEGYLQALAERDLDRRVRPRLGASDIVQQTWLEAQRGFGRFEGSGEPELVAWLARILERNLLQAVRDHALLQKRAVARERSLDDSGGAVGGGLATGVSSPSQRAMRGESAVRLARALRRLPDDQREAVRLRHIEGWSLAEIADRMDRTAPAAAGLIKRGMRALRGILDEEGEG